MAKLQIIVLAFLHQWVKVTRRSRPGLDFI